MWDEVFSHPYIITYNLTLVLPPRNTYPGPYMGTEEDGLHSTVAASHWATNGVCMWYCEQNIVDTCSGRQCSWRINCTHIHQHAWILKNYAVNKTVKRKENTLKYRLYKSKCHTFITYSKHMSMHVACLLEMKEITGIGMKMESTEIN